MSGQEISSWDIGAGERKLRLQFENECSVDGSVARTKVFNIATDNINASQKQIYGN